MKGIIKFYLLLFMLVPNLLYGDDDCLRLVAPSGTIALENIATKVSRLLNDNGVCNTVSLVPSIRGNNLFNSGKVDGVLSRIQFYGDTLDIDAIKVPTPYIVSEGLLVSKDPEIKSIEDLVKYNKSLVIIRGWLWMEVLAKEVEDKIEVIVLSNAEETAKFFKNRSPGGVLTPTPGLIYFSDIENLNVNKVIDIGLYLWLNPKHSNKVEKIDMIIANYLQDGNSFLE